MALLSPAGALAWCPIACIVQKNAAGIVTPTIQLYRSDIWRFAASVSANVKAVPSMPTLATAAVYAADTSGSYYLVSDSQLTYDAATGKLTGCAVNTIEYHGVGESAGSFAVFSLGEFVAPLLRTSTQAEPMPPC